MIKLLSLNVENHKHVDLISPFLKRQNADVILLQEVFEKDVKLYAKELNIDYVFVQLRKRYLDDTNKKGSLQNWGLGTLSKYPIKKTESLFYCGTKDLPVPVYDPNTMPYVLRALLVTEIAKNGQLFRVAHTHFTWAKDEQVKDMDKLLGLVEKYPQIVLCGDYNAPRGEEVWSKLANKYHDNVPLHIKTTIDQNIHLHKGVQVVVDGLFTSEGYKAASVQIVDGVSDHCAVVAEISGVTAQRSLT